MHKTIDDIIKSIKNFNTSADIEDYKSFLLNELEHLKNDIAISNFKFEKAVKDKNVVYSLLKRTSEDLKKALNISRIKAEQLNTLINTIPAMVFFKDLNLNYLIVNQAFLNFVQHYEVEVIGKKANEIIPGYDNANQNQKIEKEVIEKGKHVYNIIEEISRNNKTFWVSTNLAPVTDNNGERIGLIGVARDITEQKINEAELKKAKELAEQGMQAKSLFLANMSHEIRTPLNGIIGMSQILKRSNLNENQYEHLNTIISSGDSLLSLINDILDFSKIEAGKIEFVNDDFSIEEIIKDISNVLKIKAEEKGLEFFYNISDDVPEGFSGDKNRIKQIILNLANNAVKFTDKGSVSINVELIKKLKQSNKIKISVCDTGIGISKEKQNKLFKRFSQLDASTTKIYGGTGLGLAISKKLTEMMNGKIGLTSKLGEGSTFWVTLKLNTPLKKITTNNDIEKESHKVELKKHLKVLLAEDNIVNQKIASHNLKNLEYEVDIAQNGEIAVNKYLEGKYDLILMDIQMPVMNGYDASLKIRKIEKSEPEKGHIPIIALTANAMKGDMEKCLNAGMDAYLSKPFKPNDLLTVLKKFISKK
jgi:PAS domain S-box-containing protein